MWCTRDTSTLAGVLWLLRGCLHFVLFTRTAVGAGNSTDVEPYLLFSTQQSIFRHYINDNTSYSEQVLIPSTLGTLGLSYHMRLDSMYWINGNFLRPAIMSASLDGSGERELIVGDLSDPASLAVDWLNNRLYWVDRYLRQVGEYDLVTGHRSVVLTTGEAGTSSPSGLALYPYPNYGWIYWSDGNRLMKASVVGDAQSILRSDLTCVNVLAIDYASVTIYWIDHCLYLIQSLRLDGDASTHSFPFSSDILFASGLTIHNNTFFWSDTNGVFGRENTTNAVVFTVYDAPRGYRATGVQLVHPSMQPQGDDYIEIITPVNGTTSECLVVCVNGICIPPGLCACNAGWRGESCDIDLNECERQNGGCEHHCLNEIGSFHCTCLSGFALGEDFLSCEDVNECTAENGGCHQVCTNQLGAFECSCVSGFFMEEDGIHCVSLETSVDPTSAIATSTATAYDSSTSVVLIDNSQSSSASLNITSHSPVTRVSEMYRMITVTVTSSLTTSVAITTRANATNVLTGDGVTLLSSTSDTGPYTLPITSSFPGYTLYTVTLTESRSAMFPQTVTVSLQTPDPSHIPIYSTTTKTPYYSSPSLRGSQSDSSVEQTEPTRPGIPTQSLGTTSTNMGGGEKNTGGSQITVTSEPLSPTSILIPPTLEIEVVDPGPTSRRSSRDQAIIIVTVLITVCLITAAVVLLVVVILVVYRKRHKSGSFTPEPHYHTTMTFNLSVKRISNILSYTTKS